MSTSDPLHHPASSDLLRRGKGDGDLSTDPDALSRQAASLAGAPDPAILARMANEFFRAVPGGEQIGAIAPEAQRLTPPDVSSLSLPSSMPLPSAAQLPASDLISPASATSLSPVLPHHAGVLPGADFHSVPGFGFLSDVRSLIRGVPAMPIHAGLPSDIATLPYESELRNAPAGAFGTDLPEIAPSGFEAAAPQVPGVPSHLTDFDHGYPFSFLQDINSLERAAASTKDGSVSEPSSALAGNSPLAISSIPFDVNSIRRDFPILQERVNGRPLIWLDNAATTQKPQSVIDRIAHFYAHENSNIHRAAHTLAARATDAYEASREKVRRFLNAGSTEEIIFVRGATEGINLVAQSWGRRHIQKDDEIIVTHLEHHANIVPWQMLCAEKGAKLRVAPVDDSGQILLDEYEKLFNSHTKLASIAHVSNALGTVTPAAEMVEIAHRFGALALVDGAQSVSHMRVDMQELDCDFFVFSGHKIFAPTGIGVVYGKSAVLSGTPPWQGGGNMISDVTFEKTVYQPPPGRFEAGTGNIADAVGLGAALDYLDRIGMVNVARYEHDLLVYATESLRGIPGLRLIGTAKEKASVLSFVLDGYRTEDVGHALNQEGIAVRSGHHCAQPILRRFGVESTVRPSLAFYNTCDEIDVLVKALWNLKQGRGAGLA